MTNNAGEKISVCLLAYNHVDAIESTLRSILEQSAIGYEVIVSDDCSTDGTWERILELSSADQRVRPIRTPQNIGMAANANFAVAHSHRPYIALLHHDDLYRPDLLEKWDRAFDRCVNAVFVFNPYGALENDFIHHVDIPGECIDGDWFLRRRLFASWGCCVRGTAMIRRDAWNKVGGMREQYGLLADIDMWMRLAVLGPVAYVPEPVITVRHQRPDYYPAIYSGNSWSWERQRLLYNLHAENRLDYLDLATLRGKIHWLGFRLKLSCETAKWLVYAVIRGKRGMIETSDLSSTAYDLWPLRILRGLLQRIFAPYRRP